MSNTNLTTTNIAKDKLRSLRKLASQHSLKQVEFINAAIDYFRKTGINPAEEIYSPREEIARLTKRVDEVIRFLQVHERNKLSPLMERLILLERKLSEGYGKVAEKEDLKKLIAGLQVLERQLTSSISEVGQSLVAQNERAQTGMNTLKSLVVRLAKLVGLLFEAMRNRSKLGSMREEDIQNFEHALREVR